MGGTLVGRRMVDAPICVSSGSMIMYVLARKILILDLAQQVYLRVHLLVLPFETDEE